VVVFTQGLHGHLSMDTQIGVQKFHTRPTTRIGGVGIFIAVLVGVLALPAGVQKIALPLVIAGTPAFAFGLAEDITKRVSVRARLLATMACGVLGWFATGLSITDVQVPGLDWLLSFTAISVLFTAFAVGGIANAVNIIDGFNGLSSGTVLIILSGMAAIALGVGDQDVARICLLLSAAMLGFMLVNWPWGKIFLGDGGAYFIGFAVAWVAVLILARHPQISAWAPMLVCGYPILEVGFSILRRRRRKQSAGDADRLHLHSLVKRRVVRKLLPNTSNLVRNSVTGAVMWGAALLPTIIAVQWPTQTTALVAGFIVCALVYHSLYARLTQFRWCLPFFMRKPALACANVA
jgi:UDP-N-acetylmuramyl pentapeptide phosphotransferase/UDP-N-acetylglucosamine-1-phosphate transferase